MTCWAVVPAAGIGHRFGGEMPKQYRELAGRTVAEHTLAVLLAIDVRAVVVAIHPDDAIWATLAVAAHPRLRAVAGGAERADSVACALAALAAEATAEDWVLVHDIVRPCVTRPDIERLIAACGGDAVGAILATPVAETVKRAVGEGDDTRRIAETLPRATLWAAQTPQLFRYGVLRRALAAARSAAIPVTDEAAAVERLGLHPRLLEGRRDNIKITRPEDLVVAEAILRERWRAAEQDRE